MKLIIRTPVQKERKVKACVIWSFGSAYQRMLDLHLKGPYEGGTVANVIRIPGGARRLLSDEAMRKMAFDGIQKSLDRGARKIDIMIPSTQERDSGPSIQTLLTLESIVRGRFPKVEIKLIVARNDGAYELEPGDNAEFQDQD